MEQKSPNGENVPICKMYDDPEFNNLNDILHSMDEFIMTKRTLAIFKESKTIPYEIRKAKVIRKEKLFGLFKIQKSYDYYELFFPDLGAEKCYAWIDFDKSEIYAIDKSERKIKIKSHRQKLDLIQENKSNNTSKYTFEAKKIVFGKNFDFEIDFFKIPLYSWGEYVSERLKNKLQKSKITDIGFAHDKEQLGKMWQPHYPIIEFTE
ncbi:hypothetical protein [uncultured Psychroserpens sp.]|uniref:hypothetical protein n=1 Tax=uncultured Psychroserpens sp. TaxID=255436 RepID=UPI0026239274|nr:hypothetical protein [uncultured Psychroserpens sp.]